MEKGKIHKVGLVEVNYCLICRMLCGWWKNWCVAYQQDMNIMYDRSCTLVKHLKANKYGYLLDRVKFSIPSFHAYGHNAACQVT